MKVYCSSQGGPEPLEKEANEILGSKREDRFSQPFFSTDTKIVSGLYPAWLSNLCQGPQTLQKFPQKCQKIAGCKECVVYGSRPLIASKPGSSPPERPGLDNITNQPLSDATCLCTTASSTLSYRFKEKMSPRGGTGASTARPYKNCKGEAGTKNEPNWYFVPDQKKGRSYRRFFFLDRNVI